jgi:hypothetical protein
MMYLFFFNPAWGSTAETAPRVLVHLRLALIAVMVLRRAGRGTGLSTCYPPKPHGHYLQHEVRCSTSNLRLDT